MADSSHFMEAHSRIRASAGTASPASSKITSPGTSSSEGTVAGCPSRSTLEWAAVIFFNASMACSALDSCTTPITALSSTTTAMIMVSAKSDRPTLPPSNRGITAETTAAAIRMIIMGSFSCPRNRFHAGVFAVSVSLLCPYSPSRRAASPPVSPPRLLPSPSRTSWELCR